MRSLRILLSRRWLLFALTVVVLTYAAWWLGQWQFDRLDHRKQGNEVVRINESRPPIEAAQLLAPGVAVRAADEWRLVTATGTYAEEDTVIVRYRTRDGASGINVVVPLITADDTALLVDRGWMATDNRGAHVEDVPAPPAGEVSVTGWLRADGSGDSTKVSEHSTRAISSSRIGEAIGRPTYGGFVHLQRESPEAAEALEPVELPELNNGPHFFYGLQWWFFGALAIFGFCYLAWDELRRGPRSERRRRAGDAQSARSAPPSTASATPETKDEAGESTKAATRPNSSGRP